MPRWMEPKFPAATPEQWGEFGEAMKDESAFINLTDGPGAAPLHNDDDDRAEKMLGAAPLEGTPLDDLIRDAIRHVFPDLSNLTKLMRIVSERWAAAVSKNSREELEAFKKTVAHRESVLLQRLEVERARISELEARLAVKITTGTESHWRGRAEIRSKP